MPPLFVQNRILPGIPTAVLRLRCHTQTDQGRLESHAEQQRPPTQPLRPNAADTRGRRRHGGGPQHP